MPFLATLVERARSLVAQNEEIVRLSRPCYDKMHHCPGWAGGGDKYARVQRCTGGHLRPLNPKRPEWEIYGVPFWKFKFNRCNTCDVIAFPYIIRWFDPSWINYAIVRYLSDRKDRD